MGQTTGLKKRILWMGMGLFSLLLAGCGGSADNTTVELEFSVGAQAIVTDPMPPPTGVEAVSVSPDGVIGNGTTGDPHLSADGRFVVFTSCASNLVPGGNWTGCSGFILDRLTGEMSQMLEGRGLNVTSISATGRYLVFGSEDASLVPGDTNGLIDVFVYDRQTGETTRVSVDSNGNEAIIAAPPASPPAGSVHGRISADGRFVSFASNASNLVANDNNDAMDVFVHDRQTGETTRVSVDSNGNEANGAVSYYTSLSADGRFVTFESTATNLVAGDTNGRSDVFVHDRLTGETTRVSVDSDGIEANHLSASQSISADGRYVTFYSYASNLVPGDSNGTSDIFVHDRLTGETTRVSVDSDGNQWNNRSSGPSISADGRFVAFSTERSINEYGRDLFVHDRVTGETVRAFTGIDGPGNGHYWPPTFSADGRTVGFATDSTNLVAGDTNLTHDAFIAPNPMSTFDPYADDDSDGLSNRQELLETFTFYFNADSDGDGILDGAEAAGPVPAPGNIEAVSVTPTGETGYGHSHLFAFQSADGRFVAFDSSAANLVAGDASIGNDVFVRDRQAGETTLVSADSSGNQFTAGPSVISDISADGRFVTFRYEGFLDQEARLWGTYIHDRQTGETTRITQALPSMTVDLSMLEPNSSISADGRFVAYHAEIQDPVPGDTNDWDDLFLYDRLSGNTVRISMGYDGKEPNSASIHPSISADGRYVAFMSGATNLVPGVTNYLGQIYVYDRMTGELTVVSRNTAGTLGDNTSNYPSISADGRYVSFVSRAGNLVAGDTNGENDIFVHDRETGETTRVSVDSAGGEGDAESEFPSISADGRFVAFASDAANLVASDTNLQRDIFVHDRATGTTVRVSVGDTGAQVSQFTDFPTISADGRTVAFLSQSDNLVAGDANGSLDTFVAINPLSTFDPYADDDGDGLNNRMELVETFTFYFNADSDGDGIDDGTEVANGTDPAFELPPLPGPARVVSITPANDTGNDHSLNPSVSADGRFVAYQSAASDLVAGDTNGFTDVYYYNNYIQTPRLASRNADGTPGNGHSRNASASRYFVAFDSYATNLVADDINGYRDIFVHNALTGHTARVSVNSAGKQAQWGDSLNPSLNGSARYVAFESEANNLVPDDTNYRSDIFVHDRQTGETTRVSVNSDGTEGNRPSQSPAISFDGRYVAFHSSADNLVPGDNVRTWDVFVHDRLTGETTRVSVDSSGNPANTGSFYPSISGDGRFVAFSSDATNLVAGDTNARTDVFVHDRETGETTRVSVGTGGTQGNAFSGDPFITADGRFVSFVSSASNLVAGDVNGKQDVFVHDRLTGETVRLSEDGTGSGGEKPSRLPALAADGRSVAFDSGATNLVAGDANAKFDVFFTPNPLSDMDLYADDDGDGLSNEDELTQTFTHYFKADTDGDGVDDGAEVANGTDPTVPDDPSPPPAGLEAVSVAPDGSLVGIASLLPVGPVTSADGRFIAFSSYTDTLVAGDTNNVEDIFVRDRLTGETARVSVDSAGNQASGGHSYAPSISADGRFVAFESDAYTLVAGDTNDRADIFVHDRVTGETTRISMDSSGNEAIGGGSSDPSISADGRFVAFWSSASNLVPGDTNGWIDAFVHDRLTGETNRVSVSSTGAEGDNHAFGIDISSDGRFITFYSSASNLVPGDTNGVEDVFVHDRLTGETTRVSVSSTGIEANLGGSAPSISADGRFVAFVSVADNLVPGDTNATGDIFVHDRQTGETTRVSISSAGAEGNFVSFGNPSISADGRFVAFRSHATNLAVGDDTNGVPDIFIHDRITGVTIRVSENSISVESNGESTLPAMSADGRTIVFESDATNLAPGDTNGLPDVFIAPNPLSTFDPFADDDGDGLTNNREMLETFTFYFKADSDGDGIDDGTEVANGTDPAAPVPPPALILPPATTEAVSLTPGGTTGNTQSFTPAFNGDATVAAFASDATDLVAGDTNAVRDIFAYSRVTGETVRVSVSSAGAQADGASYGPSVSADGRFVAFESDATNLVDGDTNGYRDIFVHDRVTAATTRVSVNAYGKEAMWGHSYNPSISADGRFVAFESHANNLIPWGGDTNARADIFIHDRLTGETVRASVDSAGLESNSHSYRPSLSADGRFVAFESWATNLVAADTNSQFDIFVHDLFTGITTMVSVDSAGNQTDGGSFYPSISADGSAVAFASSATNLVAGDTNGMYDVFVHDLATAATTRVSVSALGDQGNGISSRPAISADGLFVTFHSDADNLVAGDTNAIRDVFVHDRASGDILRVCVDASSVEGNSMSASPAISTDGRTVGFQSWSTNLAAGDANGAADAFITPNPMSPYDPMADDDVDALNNHRELLETFTHYFKADSDGDGVEDGTEVANGTDPLNPADF